MNLDQLQGKIKNCRICEKHLPLGPRPVVQVSGLARILIVGQAPGRRVHETGVPFDDPSGDRLRSWMGIDKNIFYDPEKVAIMPMGFCFPGTGKSGDLPPRPECAVEWRQQLLDLLPNVELTLIIGQYAIEWHLGDSRKRILTDTVKAWREYWPDKAVLPHPSPRNNIWLKKNNWFEDEILPALKSRIANVLNV